MATLLRPTTDRRPGVYLLRFGTGEVYVGAAMHIGRRVRDHLRHLRNGTHHMPHIQAAFKRSSGRVEAAYRDLAIEDVYELQAVERVMIRTMVARLGRAKVLNRDWNPKPIGGHPDRLRDDDGPPELHPYE